MLFRVRLKRDHGRLLSWRDIQNGPVFEGDLRTHYMGRSHVLIACLVTPDGLATHLVPNLYEPRLVGMARMAFELRGFERLENGAAAAQEWYCTTAM